VKLERAIELETNCRVANLLREDDRTRGLCASVVQTSDLMVAQFYFQIVIYDFADHGGICGFLRFEEGKVREDPFEATNEKRYRVAW